MSNIAATHECAAEGCHLQIRSGLFMCIDHWHLVPSRVKTELRAAWRNYSRFGLEAYKEYSESCTRAIVAVREKEIKRQIKNQSTGDNLNFE